MLLSPQTLDRVQDRWEIALPQQIDRALSSEIAVATVEPVIYAVRAIDMVQALDDLGKLEQRPIALCIGRRVGVRYPILHPAFVDRNDGSHLSRCQRNLAAINGPRAISTRSFRHQKVTRSYP